MRAVSAAVRCGSSGAGRLPRATVKRSAVLGPTAGAAGPAGAWAAAATATATASAAMPAASGSAGCSRSGTASDASGASAWAGTNGRAGAATRSGAGPKTRGSSRVWKSRSDAVSTVRTALSRTASCRYLVHAPPSQTRAAAPESRRTCPTSPDLYMGLSGTTTAPAFQAARTASTKCGVFCSMTATRSPRRMPRAARWPATESESPSASA